MKRIIYFLAGVMILFFTAACNKGLEVKPTKELESDYFNSEERLQSGVGSVYAKLTDLYTYNANAPCQRLWLLPGDDLIANNPNPLDNFSGLNGSNSDINYVWGALYEVVNRANTMLEKVEENASVYVTNGLKDANKGELLFLRGWCFYNLWSWWQKAPVQTERLVGYGPHLNLPPSNGLQLLDTAINDMHNAAALLSASWPTNQTGRVTKDGAYGMLVKLYVTRADYNSKNTDDYGKALEAFASISASRQLRVQYGENFDYRFENNSESLFEFQASQSGAENPWLSNDFGFGVGSMGAYYQFFENSWTNQGTLVVPTEKLINAFDPLDPRRNASFKQVADAAWAFNDGYKFIKYTPDGGGIYGGIASINSINNYRILRLADVKLLASEAFLQTAQPEKALEQINDIRARARKSTTDGSESPAPAALTTVTMTDIMQERYVELAGEANIRWDDLRRWHAAGFINLANWTLTDFGFAPDYSSFKFNAGTHLLMPIPTTELDNNPNMLESGQNPGY